MAVVHAQIIMCEQSTLYPFLVVLAVVVVPLHASRPLLAGAVQVATLQLLFTELANALSAVHGAAGKPSRAAVFYSTQRSTLAQPTISGVHRNNQNGHYLAALCYFYA